MPQPQRKPRVPSPLSFLTADDAVETCSSHSSLDAKVSDESRSPSISSSESAQKSPPRTATVHNPYSFEGLLEVVLDDKADSGPTATPSWCNSGITAYAKGCCFASLNQQLNTATCLPAVNPKPVLYMPAPLLTSSHSRAMPKKPEHVTLPQPGTMPKGMPALTTANLQLAMNGISSPKNAASSIERQNARQGIAKGDTARRTSCQPPVTSSLPGHSTPPVQRGNSPGKWKRHGVGVSNGEVLRQLRIHWNNGLADILINSSDLSSNHQVPNTPLASLSTVA